jgi:hypothetical protein
VKEIMFKGIENPLNSRHQWLIPVIPDTWEAEIRRIIVGGQHGQII